MRIMGKNVTKDSVLIALVCVVVLLLLIPVNKGDSAREDPATEYAEPMEIDAEELEGTPSFGAMISSGPIAKAKAVSDAMEKRYDRMGKIAEDPEKMLARSNTLRRPSPSGSKSSLHLVGGEHPLMPLIPGSVWEYEVSGDRSIIPNSRWTMKVVTAPQGGEPGVLEIGFGDSFSSVHVWRQGDTFRIDWLPFVEPLQYLNNRPSEVSGVFLGAPAQMIEKSVWISEYTRHVLYQYRGNGEETFMRVGLAKQSDRAEVKGIQKIVALTTAHDAYVIEWSSLFEMVVNGRPVLNTLTTDSYRREKMWMVPNIGIVRREIQYKLNDDSKVVFDLVHYSKPASTPSGPEEETVTKN